MNLASRSVTFIYILLEHLTFRVDMRIKADEIICIFFIHIHTYAEEKS